MPKHVTCGVCGGSRFEDRHCSFCGSYQTLRVNGMMLYIDIATGKMIAKAGSMRDRIERVGRKVGVTV